jgi:hypothetical protein
MLTVILPFEDAEAMVQVYFKFLHVIVILPFLSLQAVCESFDELLWGCMFLILLLK